MKGPAKRRIFGILVLGLAGCGPDPIRESDRVSTRDMQLNVNATDDGTFALVEVQIASPIGAIKLVAGDAFFVTVGGKRIQLSEAERNGGPIYTTQPDALGGDITLDLERTADRDAHGLVIAVPPPFTLTASGLTAAAPLSLAWEPGPESSTSTLTIEGSCITALTRTLDTDDGALDIAQSELGPAGSPTCPLDVTLTRTAITQGKLFSLDPGGGIFATATQRRTIEVPWSP
jgi:hypothetical protein